MKVVILAAGIGSRLTSGQQPKALIKLPNGKCLLEMQLEVIERHLSLDEVIVVVGHQKEAIFSSFPDLFYVDNPAYAEENTAKSLLRAIKKVECDLIWINGDLLFAPTVFDQLMTYVGSNAMVVNRAAVGEEEVKYVTKEGCITAVSKRIADGEGEAVGLNLFNRDALPLLREGLEVCGSDDYFEKGIEWAIEKGAMVASVVVADNSCIEIDFPEDLTAAAALASRWSAHK